MWPPTLTGENWFLYIGFLLKTHLKKGCFCFLLAMNSNGLDDLSSTSQPQQSLIYVTEGTHLDIVFYFLQIPRNCVDGTAAAFPRACATARAEGRER